jgi:hypothetical protein
MTTSGIERSRCGPGCQLALQRPAQRLSYLALAGILFISGCTTGWTTLARADITTTTLEAATLRVQQMSLGQLKQLAADQSAVLFDSSKTTGGQLAVTIGGRLLSLKKQPDGQWVTETGVAVTLIAAGKVSDATHVVLLENRESHTVCDITSKLTAMPSDALLGSLKGNMSEWKSQGDIVVACYRLGSFMPAGPLARLVTFEVTGLRFYFVPKDSTGELDASKEGVALWSSFDRRHPSGVGYAARVKVVP